MLIKLIFLIIKTLLLKINSSSLNNNNLIKIIFHLLVKNNQNPNHDNKGIQNLEMVINNRIQRNNQE